ncbi:hypothetical protein [Algoriphagus aquimarinus]|uniref:hypothetical protein n=1 Tax=Algoriphagus aquimarinus TaxID=237018 RepID=UPI0030D806B8|tara:strand:+ start:224612 stop:224905 length:294 start_codon:yes stop_codon:yes gene_type:complete
MEAFQPIPYELISEEEAQESLRNPMPIFKVALYGVLMDDGPENFIFIKFLPISIYGLSKYDENIRVILRKQFKDTLAFRYEEVSIMVTNSPVSKEFL